MKKRDFLKISSIMGAGFLLSPEFACKNLQKSSKTSTKDAQTSTFQADPLLRKLLEEKGVFSLAPLPYHVNGLEPHLDAQTMEIHHDKHHAAYLKKLNEGIANTPFASQTLGEILANVSTDSKEVLIRNNAGGHFNHSLFWQTLAEKPKAQPAGKLAAQIITDFGSFEGLITQLKEAGTKVFGSGWIWLCYNENSKLFLTSTPNQDNPLMDKVLKDKGFPLLGIDVWEHAYYLKYQNERKKYLEAVVKCLHWELLEQRFEFL